MNFMKETCIIFTMPRMECMRTTITQERETTQPRLHKVKSLAKSALRLAMF